MLDIKETEIVSRDDLIPPKSPEIPAQNVDWSSVLGYTIDQDASPEDIDVDSASSASKSDKAAAEVEFRLFAPLKGSDSVQKYILPASPPPDLDLKTQLDTDPSGNVKFTEKDVEAAHSTHRPTSYYLTPPLEDGDERSMRIRATAISGEEVLKASSQRWKGCEMPWRVTKLEITTSPVQKDKTTEKYSSDTIQAVPVTKEKRSRHRPNKKRRICLRKKRAKEEEVKASKNAIKKKNKKARAEASTAVAQVHKRTEEEDREKKARLNRLKKARRKLKSKEDKPLVVESTE